MFLNQTKQITLNSLPIQPPLLIGLIEIVAVLLDLLRPRLLLLEAPTTIFRPLRPPKRNKIKITNYLLDTVNASMKRRG